MLIYPKVLIVGETFQHRNGGGITMCNLFDGWPKNKIGVLTERVNESEPYICEIYYRLGIDELKSPWPFSYIQKIDRSGPININEIKIRPEKSQNQFAIQKVRSIIKNIFLWILNTIGLYNLYYNPIISKKLLEWIKDFKPDIIYFQPNTILSLKIMKKLYDQTNIPYVVHIMDDVVRTMNRPGLLYIIWQNYINKSFKYLIERASQRLTICQAMSQEYRSRYNQHFLWFHNPIEVEKWLPFSKNSWHVEEKFRILYTGRIQKDVKSTMIKYCKAIDTLNREGQKVIFDIYSPQLNSKETNKYMKFKGVNVKKPLPHNEMPKLLSTYDLLFLPLGFTRNAIKFSRLSMPTKTSEYMISSTPVFVYASDETAIYKYASDEGWGYCVNDRNIDKLVKAIKLIIADSELREKLGKKAKELAHRSFNAQFIKMNFHKIMSEVATIRDHQV